MKRILILTFFALAILSGCKESMDSLADRVFDVAAQQAILMDARLDDQTMPRSFDNNEFISSKLTWWCSGFFPGSLWYIYKYTGDENIKSLAEKQTWKLENIPDGKFDHDLGFQMNCSFGNAMRIGGDTLTYAPVLVRAANALATRYSPVTKVIRSWDNKKWTYPVIIDNMMNLELLTEGYRLSKIDSLMTIAQSHANTTMINHYREDVSCFHVVDYDPTDGHIIAKKTSQGYADDSSWSRGQAWGLYGYAMMYDQTGVEEYLVHAEKIAKLLLGMLPEDGIPWWDFNAPDVPDALRDASAGAIMASGFQKLSTLTADKNLAKECAATAETQIRTLASEEYLAKIGENGNFLLKHSVGHFKAGSEVDVPLTYADYYFLEAILRYKGLVR